jgi:RNA polymerase sigma factor (TIGR02999 family)
MERDDVSRLLDEVKAGNNLAFEPLISLVYYELRRIAASLMRGQVNGRTLQPTALVNEAYLRLAGGQNQWDSKAHFFGAAARAMRQVLISEAERRSSRKRAGDLRRVTFRDLAIAAEEPEVDVLALDEAITALAAVDPRLTRVIELRYFAGCSLEEIADLTGCSVSTVKRDWTYARAWLFDRMTA